MTERFKAVGEDGTIYVVLKVEESTKTQNVEGSSTSNIPTGLYSFQLPDGRKLNRRDDHTFVIVQTGQVLRRMTEPPQI